MVTDREIIPTSHNCPPSNSKDNPALSTWLVKKTNKYTSWQMQNKMLKVITLEVLRDVAASLHSSPFYSIMADSSNCEQVVIRIRWVDNSLNAHEEFIGLQQVDRIDAATTIIRIKDVLQRMNLWLTGARGHSVMMAAAQCLVPKKCCHKH